MSVPLLATCWTTAGDAAPQVGDERSPIPLRTRIETAAAAGWTGFGLVHADLVAFREQHPLSDLASMLRENGMDHVEVEFLGEWWTTGAPREASDRLRTDLLDAAAELGAQTIKIAPDIGATTTLDVVRGADDERFLTELDALATQATDAGTRVALEPMPFSRNVRSLDDGVAVLRAIGNPGAGLCVDIWHVFRQGTDYARVAELPAEYLFVVELDDGAAEPEGTLWSDTIDRRRYPGRGDFRVPEFIAAVRATGYTGAWGVEIISAEHRAQPITESLPQLAGEVRACFAEAETTTGQ